MLPIVVRAIVFNTEGSILLTKHQKESLWVLPGGHMESGEDPHSAIIRELYEEFSLTARFFEVDTEEILHHKGKKLHHHPLPLTIYDLSYKNASGVDKSRKEYVFLMESDGNIGEVEKDEIFEYAWFDPETILTMKPNIETYDFIQEMLEKIIGNDEEFE